VKFDQNFLNENGMMKQKFREHYNYHIMKFGPTNDPSENALAYDNWVNSFEEI